MLDGIILLLILFFALIGLRQGFWLYTLELLFIGLSLGLSGIYYLKRQELLPSIFLFIGVFLGLKVGKWLILKLRPKGISRPPRSLLNRLGGAILGVAWGSLMAVLFILVLELLPLEAISHYGIKQKLQTSTSYALFQRLMSRKELTRLENIRYMSKVALDEQAKLRLSQQAQFQELLAHPRLKAILQDPQTIRQLQNKDLPALLANPKIRQLLNDGQFVEKFLQLDFKQALEE